jgi:hypothetical protein
MKTISRRQSAASLVSAVLSLAIAAHQVVLVGGMLLGLRRVTGGLAAWAGLFGLVFLGIAAIVLLFGLPAYYRNGARGGKLAFRFFRTFAIQCFLYPVLSLLTGIEYTFPAMTTPDFVLGAAGLAAGALFTILAVLAARRGAGGPTKASEAA